MNEPDIGDREFTGYTFGMSYTEWLLGLRYLPVADLGNRLEIKRWQVIDPEIAIARVSCISMQSDRPPPRRERGRSS